MRCPNGHDDIVKDGTRNHNCEKCGSRVINHGAGLIICLDGHSNFVEGITQSHFCNFKNTGGSFCGKECRRDKPKH